ncbi:MAG: 3-phosphoshikimate 1-carboxyvinyltransferase [Muribaculaceae bacterium]|nr:3-phosphoshikimate 1-carboxyvinyltransferase [Muribaculaceae bacterium]
MDYIILPPDEMPEGKISLPLSKSISNRALIIGALSGATGCLKQVAKCDDTDVMVSALSSEATENINIGAAGTAMRFLTAYYASQSGRTITIDGSERMRQRPIKVLVDALRQCGAVIEYQGEEGFPPLKITGTQLSGGVVELSASISSQYISALLMIAPKMSQGLTLKLIGDVMSRPYIMMTLNLMKRWGINYEMSDNEITIAPQQYHLAEFQVEADWSGASYWYEMTALSSGCFDLVGLEKNSIQGDAKVADIFGKLGVDSQWNDDGILELVPTPDTTPRLVLDMCEQPDLAQTVVVTACLLGIPFHITGLSTLKIKETNRLTALQTELRKLSFDVEIINDSELAWSGERCPVDAIKPIAIETYEDHRMAMAFAPAAFFVPGLIIKNAGVITKSYPDFWEHMRSVGFRVEDVEMFMKGKEDAQ